MLSVPFLFLALSSYVCAQPATLRFSDCFSGGPSNKINVSTIYAQVLNAGHPQAYLNLTLFGTSNQDIPGQSTQTTSLSTLFTSTNFLTLSVFMNSSYFCTPLRPPSPLSADQNSTSTYCPIPAGPFGFSASVPWGGRRELTTLITRLRAVDPFGSELLCIDVSTTPLQPGRVASPYGNAAIVFWTTVTLAIAYWLTVGIARIVSAWNRGVSKASAGWWSRVENAGFIFASAISGERLATSPALMRFVTPSMRDIVFHTQWCAVLSMVAVQWPKFVYPLLAQTAWSTLIYNVTLVDHHNAPFHHWDPLSVKPFNPPTGFVDQINDPNSPLYINVSTPNTLFTLPDNATSGISSFAYTVGLHPQDLFSVCLTVFLAIIAGTVLFSLLVWLLDWLAASLLEAFGADTQQDQISRLPGARSPLFSKDLLESAAAVNGNADENRSIHLSRVTSRFGRSATSRKAWWRRTYINSFHGSVLHGNLVRILVLFHLPVTIFSCYQMTLPRSQASLTSIVLAAMSFIIFSIALPVLLVIRVTITTTNKLYDETRTLLSLGPLYNHYRHGSQLFAFLLFATNFAFGVTIGCGQKSGTAQAVIILVVEVVSALVTSIWLPWGSGAGMGLISFLFCVARIVVAVLLVILTPTISIGDGAGGWVAYGILMILALVYSAFILMLILKFVEAAMRVASGIGFDYSNHVIDSGLLGVCGLIGCCGPRQRQRSHRRRLRATGVSPSQISSFSPPNESGVVKTHSGPPSVLRPEHALRPYKEDSDDENGHIMGAWQPFPGPGYHNLEESPPSPVQHRTTAGSTGFSRVAGGRAHFDSPYAIASSSTQPFQSLGRNNEFTSPPSMAGVIDERPRHFVVRSQESNVQPTTVPSHVRTISQTAIVEDSSVLLGNLSPSRRTPESPPDQQQRGGERQTSSVSLLAENTPRQDTGDSPGGQPKKKPWYVLRRLRPWSEGSSLPSAEQILLSTSPGSPPGRSFVVIRDRKPQGHTPQTSNQMSNSNDNTTPSSVDPVVSPRRRSLGLEGTEDGDQREWNATT